MNRHGRAKHPGLWIALYGPDGAGKSAVRRALRPSSLPRSVVFSFIACGFRLAQSVAHCRSHRSHARQPRGLVLSCLKLLYMFAQSWLAHLLRVLSWLARGHFVIADRYFLDFAIIRNVTASPRRASDWRRSWAGSHLTDLQFVLDVPANELQRRKPEVSLGESRRQRQEYAARIARLPNTALVNADRPVTDVSIDISREILQLRQCGSSTASATLHRAGPVRPANFVEP